MKHVQFDRNNEGIKQLAIFLAQLVKEGMEYKIENSELFIKVELTGGY